MKPSHNNSLFKNIYEQPYNERTRLKLYNSVKGNVDFIQRLALHRSLPIHNGCVNCICWNGTGEYLLSGSDDQCLVISHAYNFKMLTEHKTSHRANIFSAKFLPCSGDKHVVSCSGDGIILFTDLFRPSETCNNQFNCHKGTTYEIATVPNEPYTFLSCGEDATVRSYDLRIKEKCTKENCYDDVLISCQRAVTALSINSTRPYQIAVGNSDSTVRLYDRRMIDPIKACSVGARPFAAFTAPGMLGRSYRITSLAFSPQGDDVLVSYSSEHLYLFNTRDDTTTELGTTVSGEDDQEEEDEGSTKSPCGLPPVRRLRLRGDWSDTGPDARPERDAGRNTDAAQVRPTVHATLMQRMTDVLSRMLNDPATRAVLSHGGEDDHHDFTQDNRSTEDQSRGRDNPEESPVVAVSIEGIYQDSTSQQGVDPMEIANEVASGRRWSPPIASPTTSSLEDSFLVLPSFESSFPSVALSPAANSSPACSPPSPPAAMMVQRGDDLTNFTDELSSMRNNIVESLGMEPMVNLTFSDKGSTASRISLSVPGDQHEGTAGPSSQQFDTPMVQTSCPEPMQYEDEDSDDEMEEMILRRQLKKSKSMPSRNENEFKVGFHKPYRKFTKKDTVKLMRPSVKQKYTGHRNARTMIKEATFWGDNYVMSGSDCGHVFMWDRTSAQLVMLLEADHHVVNCLQPHPFLPMLATSGIDYDVKIWAPIQPEAGFNLHMAEELVKRNEVMLEETRDTITVPASFMIRMLACLNQIRRGGRSRNRRTDFGSGDNPQE